MILETLANCKKCELHKTRKKIVIGAGTIFAPAMLVGECPGREEDESGIPFVGPAGRKLNESLDILGIARKNLYITNVVKCFPFYSLNPKEEHILACYPYVLEQIKIVRPKLIVMLGSIATSFFLGGNPKITSLSGKIIEKYGGYLLPVVHPSYVLRKGMTTEAYSEHLKPIKSFYKDYREITNGGTNGHENL